MECGIARLIIPALLSLTLVAGCNRENGSPDRATGTKTLKVVTGTAAIDSSGMDNYYIGTAEASVETPASFATQGTVGNVFVAEGQIVGRGQVLATLVASSYENALKMAEAQEKQAKDAYDRLSKVYKDGSLPDIKFVEVESRLQQAVSARQIAGKNLDDCILRAPASGVVGKKNVEPGMNIIPANPVLTIFRIDEVYIKIPVPENEIPGIKKGEKAIVRIAALNNKEYEGVIKEIGVVADQVSHTFDVKVLVRNKGREIKPGMACNVYLGRNGGKGVLTVPYSAIVGTGGSCFVYVLNPDGRTVRKQPVTTGNYRNNRIVVRSGLNLNDRIIVEGQHYLYDNATVEVTK